MGLIRCRLVFGFSELCFHRFRFVFSKLSFFSTSIGITVVFGYHFDYMYSNLWLIWRNLLSWILWVFLETEIAHIRPKLPFLYFKKQDMCIYNTKYTTFLYSSLVCIYVYSYLLLRPMTTIISYTNLFLFSFFILSLSLSPSGSLNFKFNGCVNNLVLNIERDICICICCRNLNLGTQLLPKYPSWLMPLWLSGTSSFLQQHLNISFNKIHCT